MAELPSFPITVERAAALGDVFPSRNGRARFGLSSVPGEYSEIFRTMLVSIHSSYWEAQSRFSAIASDEELLAQSKSTEGELSRYARSLMSSFDVALSCLSEPSMDLDDRQTSEYEWIFRASAVTGLVDAFLIPEEGVAGRLPAWVLSAEPELATKLQEMQKLALEEMEQTQLFFQVLEISAIFDDRQGVAQLLHAWLEEFGMGEDDFLENVRVLASYYSEVPSLSELACSEGGWEEGVEKRRALAAQALITLGGVEKDCLTGFLWRLNLIPDDDRDWVENRICSLLDTLGGNDSPISWMGYVALLLTWLHPTAAESEISSSRSVGGIVMESVLLSLPDRPASALDPVFAAIFKRDTESIVYAICDSINEFGGSWLITHLVDLLFFAGRFKDEEAGQTFRDFFLVNHANTLSFSGALPNPLGARLAVDYACGVSEKFGRAKFDALLRYANSGADTDQALRLAISRGSGKAGAVIATEAFHKSAAEGEVLHALRWAQQAVELGECKISEFVEILGAKAILSAADQLISMTHNQTALQAFLSGSENGRLEWLFAYAHYKSSLTVERPNLTSLILSGSADPELLGELFSVLKQEHLHADEIFSLARFANNLESDVLNRVVAVGEKSLPVLRELACRAFLG